MCCGACNRSRAAQAPLVFLLQLLDEARDKILMGTPRAITQVRCALLRWAALTCCML